MAGSRSVDGRSLKSGRHGVNGVSPDTPAGAALFLMTSQSIAVCPHYWPIKLTSLVDTSNWRGRGSFRCAASPIRLWIRDCTGGSACNCWFYDAFTHRDKILLIHRIFAVCVQGKRVIKMGEEELCPTWWRIFRCFCAKMRNRRCPIWKEGVFFNNSERFLCAETNTTMPLCISFLHYFVSVTNSPVSLLLNLFFFPSFLFWGEIFLSAPWGFFFSTAQCVLLPPCLSVLLSAFGICKQTKPKIFVCKWGQELFESSYHWEAALSCDTTIHRRVLHHGLLCLCERRDRKWTRCGDERGFRPRGGGYTGASVLCVCRWVAPSVHLSGRPQRDVCPATRVIQNTHTHIQMRTERSTPSSDW